MSNSRSYPTWLRIFAAIPIVALAAIMRAETLQVLGTRAPFLTFYPAVMIAALFGRLAGGSLATILSILLANYLWIEPVGNFKIGDPADYISTIVFLINCIMISFITEVMHRTQARLKETEKRIVLQESETRYRTLFDNMLNGFAHCKMLYDDQGHPADFVYLEVNRAFGLLTGLDDVIGKKATEVIPGIKESNAEMFEFYGRVARMGPPEKFEVEVEPLKRYFSISVYSLEPDHFVAVFDNITEQKQAEKALQEQAALLDLAHDAIFVRGAGDSITYWNLGAKRSYGWTHEEAIGRVTHELLKTRFPKPLSELNAEVAEKGVWEGELTHSRKDGREIVVASRWAVQRDSWGRQVGVLEINRDITERKHAEESLKKWSADLENLVAARTAELVEKDQILLMQSRLAAMGEMLSNIAHQWRQPLNSLGIRIQTVRLHHEKGNFTKEAVDKFVDDSMKQIHHMSQTIDDFRNFFKPEKAKTDFKVKDAVNSALSLLEGVMASKHIAIVADNLGDDLLINGYPNEYSQVLMNILTNAKDAFEEHRPENPLIVITAGNEGGKSVVTVRDNAGGIPEDIIGKVFDPHFSTKGPQGTGIGLYMAKTIIERNMNGRLTARNTSEGAEFKIEV